MGLETNPISSKATMPEKIDIDPRRKGLITKEITEEGEGDETPPNGARVTVHYTGMLQEGLEVGHVFDCTRKRNKPFTFDLKRGQVIKAWEHAVSTMRKGERAIIVTDSIYAYCGAGSPPAIPPNATLRFDIKVLDWKYEDLSPREDGSILRIRQVIGKRFLLSNIRAAVEVDLTGIYDGRIFDKRIVAYNVGEGEAQNIIPGLEIALYHFREKETARLIIKAQHAFGAEGSKEHRIPAHATVEYVATMLSIKRAKPAWSFDDAEIIDQTNIYKEKGNVYFQDGKFKLAHKMYRQAKNFLRETKNKEFQEEMKALKLVLYLNLSLCSLKLGENFEAIRFANKALAMEPYNVKGLFRRGCAHLAVGETKLARDDFEEVLKIQPGNTAVGPQLMECTKKEEKVLNIEKSVYSNMFDKFAKMDAVREESEKQKEPNVMSSVGEWGKEDREREPSDFERENPNILLLSGSGQFKDM